MALTLDDLASDVSVIDVMWGDHTIPIGFNPSVLTPKMTRELRNKAAHSETEEDATAEIVDILCKMIVHWDIYATTADELAHNALPITPEVMESLPGLLLAAILKAIVEGATQSPNSLPAVSDVGSDPPISMTSRKR